MSLNTTPLRLPASMPPRVPSRRFPPLLPRLAPEREEVDRDGLERRGADEGVIREGSDDRPAARLQSKDFEGSLAGVDEPGVLDTFPGAAAELLDAVEAIGAR